MSFWNEHDDSALLEELNAFDQQKGRQMQLMLTSIRERLRKHAPGDIAAKAGIVFDPAEKVFRMESLGEEIVISCPGYEIRQSLEMWHALTLLQYMETADGTLLSGRLISLTEMEGGLSRGYGFNKDIETMFHRYFPQTDPDSFRKACESLGGEIINGKGDVTAVIRYAPRFPVTVNIWCADDEFPASGKTLIDSNAGHYLTIEAAGGACATVVQAIRDRIGENRENIKKRQEDL